MHELNDLIDVANGTGDSAQVLLSRPMAERLAKQAKRTSYRLTKDDLKINGAGFMINGGKLKACLRHIQQQAPDAPEQVDPLDLLDTPDDTDKEALAQEQAIVSNRTQNLPPQDPKEPTRHVEGPALEDEDEGKAGVVEDDGEPSEVAGMNASEAIDTISRMRSEKHLTHILATDKRKSVQEAARDRLNALSGG